MLFKIREFIWVIVSEIEDWLYPYQDRPVEDNPYDHNKSFDYDEVNYLKSQLDASRQNIERLQSEMIYVLSIVNKSNDDGQN
tara:strand:- start:157 stop:402 length:246 start_codon:yes stop_codon:yes gene_type:complete